MTKYASVIAQIGQMTRPQITEGRTIDFAGAIDNYYKAKNAKEKQELLQQQYADQQAKEELLNRQKQALSDALAGGDQDAINSAYAQYDPSGLLKYKQALEKQDRDETFKKWLINQQQQNAVNLENLRQKNAMEKLNTVGSSSGFGKTQAGLALGIMSDPDATDEQKAWASMYLSKDQPESIFETAKQRRSGTLSANAEQAEQEKQAVQDRQVANIDQLLEDIDANPELLGVYSPYATALGRLTGGRIGYTKDQLATRGDLIRQIGQIQNTILAEARASGQTGINTMAEIRQATKGLDENSSTEEIKGALNALKKAKSKFSGKTEIDDPLGVR